MIRNKIWEDMKEAKTYQLSCLYYVDKKRKFNRYYNYAIIIIASLGAFTFFINHWCTFGTTIVTFFLEIFKNFVPAMCQPEKELVELDNLATYYGETSRKLEELWTKYELGYYKKEKTTVSKELYNLLNDKSENDTKMNRLIHSLSKKEDEKIQDQTDEYLKSKYYGQENKQ